MNDCSFEIKQIQNRPPCVPIHNRPISSSLMAVTDGADKDCGSEGSCFRYRVTSSLTAIEETSGHFTEPNPKLPMFHFEKIDWMALLESEPGSLGSGWCNGMKWFVSGLKRFKPPLLVPTQIKPVISSKMTVTLCDHSDCPVLRLSCW